MPLNFPDSPTLNQTYTYNSRQWKWNGTAWDVVGNAITGSQPTDADLSAIADLAGTSGFLKKTAADTWTLDTNTYLTGNQSISVSGDASGSGTTSISLTLANSGVTAGTYNDSATTVTPLTIDAKGRVTATGTAVTITPSFADITSKPTTLSGYGITDAQALDADLTAIAALTATSGFLKKTATDTWALSTIADGDLPSTLSAKTLVDPAITGTILEDVFTITDAVDFEIDPSNGSVQLITLGASRTPKGTNFLAGESVTLMVDDGTAYALTWTDATWGGTGVVWKTNAGVAPTLNTTGYTVIVLWKVGIQVYGARVGDA